MYSQISENLVIRDWLLSSVQGQHHRHIKKKLYILDIQINTNINLVDTPSRLLYDCTKSYTLQDNCKQTLLFMLLNLVTIYQMTNSKHKIVNLASSQTNKAPVSTISCWHPCRCPTSIKSYDEEIIF